MCSLWRAYGSSGSLWFVWDHSSARMGPRVHLGSRGVGARGSSGHMGSRAFTRALLKVGGLNRIRVGSLWFH